MDGLAVLTLLRSDTYNVEVSASPVYRLPIEIDPDRRFRPDYEFVTATLTVRGDAGEAHAVLSRIHNRALNLTLPEGFVEPEGAIYHVGVRHPDGRRLPGGTAVGLPDSWTMLLDSETTVSVSLVHGGKTLLEGHGVARVDQEGPVSVLLKPVEAR